MAMFKVEYSFDGFGSCLIEAEDEDAAKEAYYEGNFTEDEEDDGQNYEAQKIYRACSVCRKPEDPDGRCGCTNKDAN